MSRAPRFFDSTLALRDLDRGQTSIGCCIEIPKCSSASARCSAKSRGSKNAAPDSHKTVAPRSSNSATTPKVPARTAPAAGTTTTCPALPSSISVTRRCAPPSATRIPASDSGSAQFASRSSNVQQPPGRASESYAAANPKEGRAHKPAAAQPAVLTNSRRDTFTVCPR